MMPPKSRGGDSYYMVAISARVSAASGPLKKKIFNGDLVDGDFVGLWVSPKKTTGEIREILGT